MHAHAITHILISKYICTYLTSQALPESTCGPGCTGGPCDPGCTGSASGGASGTSGGWRLGSPIWQLKGNGDGFKNDDLRGWTSKNPSYFGVRLLTYSQLTNFRDTQLIFYEMSEFGSRCLPFTIKSIVWIHGRSRPSVSWSPNGFKEELWHLQNPMLLSSFVHLRWKIAASFWDCQYFTKMVQLMIYMTYLKNQ